MEYVAFGLRGFRCGSTRPLIYTSLTVGSYEQYVEQTAHMQVCACIPAWLDGWLAGWMDGCYVCVSRQNKNIYIYTHIHTHTCTYAAYIHIHTQHGYIHTYIHTDTYLPTRPPIHMCICEQKEPLLRCVCVCAKRQHLHTSSNGAPRPTKRQHALLTSRSLALKRPCQPCPGRELCLTNDRTVI